jgi:drug/metabolite transporter (DMT)-like permease
VALLGLVAALVASALFNVGVALQGLEARRAPRATGLRLSMLTVLLRRRLWLLGLVLGLVGVAPQVLAYATAPFVVVQPALAAGLLLLLAIGVRVFGEHVGAREVAGVLAIIGGIALVAAGAPPHSETHRGGGAVIAVVLGLGIVALLPFVLRGTRLGHPALTVIAAGCGFGAANVATKLFGDDAGAGHYANAAAWALVALLAGIVATITTMTAFQQRTATMVVPVSTSIQTYLPIVLEPLFLRERWSAVSLSGVPLAVGLVLGLIGTLLTANNRAVGNLAAAAQR